MKYCKYDIEAKFNYLKKIYLKAIYKPLNLLYNNINKGEINMDVIKIENSSQIEALGYENEMLLVRFKTGSVYCYSGVPRGVYDDMINAPSKGHYLNESIKPKYTCTKLTR